jgi:ribosome biogenesis protein UTP30
MQSRVELNVEAVDSVFPLTYPITTMANTKSARSAVAAKAQAQTVDKIEPVAFPSTFKLDQARKAVTALLAHHAKEKERISETQLMAKDEHVWLVVNTKEMPTKKSMKPVRV